MMFDDLNDSLVVALRRAARDSRGENKGSFRVKKMSNCIPGIFFIFLKSIFKNN